MLLPWKPAASPTLGNNEETEAGKQNIVNRKRSIVNSSKNNIPLKNFIGLNFFLLLSNQLLVSYTVAFMSMPTHPALVPRLSGLSM